MLTHMEVTAKHMGMAAELSLQVLSSPKLAEIDNFFYHPRAWWFEGFDFLPFAWPCLTVRNAWVGWIQCGARELPGRQQNENVSHRRAELDKGDTTRSRGKTHSKN